MNDTEKLLQNIVENARMGEYACQQLLQKTQDEPMRQELMRQQQDYTNAAAQAEEQLTSLGVRPEPKGPMARMGMWMGMQFNTAMDHSASHIADMLIQGATMGVVEITKARNSNPDADAQAQGIASAMITFQQEAIERMKSFLGEKVVVK